MKFIYDFKIIKI